MSWHKTIDPLKLQKRTCKNFVAQEYVYLWQFLSPFKSCESLCYYRINEKYCICNNPNHPSGASKSKGVWEWKGDTQQESTECYGLHPELKRPVHFKIHLYKNLVQFFFFIQYLRCDIETEMEKLCLILLGVWRIPMPSLIMRMIGDAVSTLHIKLEKELLHGISEAAVASGEQIRLSDDTK